MQPLRQRDPRSFGRYRLLARIGAGGMAVVYFGRSVGGRAVAVKAMHGELAGDEAYRDRFRREVAATLAAGGRYSPAVVDAAPDDTIPWLATEFLPAVALRELVAGHGPLTADEVWPIAAGAAEALAAIHLAGVVHLDLKPANVLLTADGLKVIDFGIAAVGVPAAAPAGTPGFRSPEQARGRPVGPASDVFSFGATLAYAVTGAPPSDETVLADERLRWLITSCLRADPAERPSVRELVASLAERSADGTLPPAALAEVDRRAREAEQLKIVAAGCAPARSRRAVLISAAAVVAAAGAVAVPAIVRGGNRSVPGAAAPATRRPPTTAPTTATTFAPIDTPKTLPLEVQLADTILLSELTLSVNGQVVESLTNVALPWNTYVDVPGTGTITWRIDYRGPAGQFSWAVGIAGAWLDHGTQHLTEPENVGSLTETH